MSLLKESIEAILEKSRFIAKSETLIGDPIKFDGILIVPVVKVSIGFGAGAGEGGDSKSGKGTGGGAGGGIKVEPACFLVHDGTTVRVLPAEGSKSKGIDSVLEKIPDLFTYAMDSVRGKGEDKKDCNCEENDDTGCCSGEPEDAESTKAESE